MPENPFKEAEDSRNTEIWTEVGETPAETGIAPKATDSVEPGTTDK